jgi:uncharacterized protein
MMIENHKKLIDGIIERLGLSPHEEGGWFLQTHVSEGVIPGNALPSHAGERSFCTSILFLITEEDFSAFHRIASDEIWYHHEGDPVEIRVIGDDGDLYVLVLGPASKGFSPQATVPGGSWFASSVAPGGRWALTGCAVTPGFDYRDFELADRKALIAEYPRHAETIRSLTRIEN